MNIKHTYGNDLEGFILNNKENKIVSAIGVLKHDKYDPIKLGNGVELYWDNCLLEFKINPYKNKQEMVHTFKDAFKRIQKYLGKDYSLQFKATHTFEDEEVCCDEAQQIGCGVAYDALKVEVLPQLTCFPSNLRSSGGHWHLSSKRLVDDFNARINTCKLSEIFAGCANVVYSNDPTEKERRKIYGHPFSHRCPPHGLEIRSMSSSFINSIKKTELTYDLISHAIELEEKNKSEEIFKEVDLNKVKTAINECDKVLAMEILVAAKTPKSIMERIEECSILNEDFYTSWGI